MVTVSISLTVPQTPDGSLVVRVSVTLPAPISAAEGVYVDVGLDAFPKIPVPEVVHVAAVAPPPYCPLRVTALPLQLAMSGPAFTIGAWLTLTTTDPVALPQPLDVTVRLYVPFAAVVTFAIEGFC